MRIFTVVEGVAATSAFQVALESSRQIESFDQYGGLVAKTFTEEREACNLIGEHVAVSFTRHFLQESEQEAEYSNWTLNWIRCPGEFVPAASEENRFELPNNLSCTDLLMTDGLTGAGSELQRKVTGACQPIRLVSQSLEAAITSLGTDKPTLVGFACDRLQPTSAPLTVTPDEEGILEIAQNEDIIYLNGDRLVAVACDGPARRLFWEDNFKDAFTMRVRDRSRFPVSTFCRVLDDLNQIATPTREIRNGCLLKGSLDDTQLVFVDAAHGWEFQELRCGQFRDETNRSFPRSTIPERTLDKIDALVRRINTRSTSGRRAECPSLAVHAFSKITLSGLCDF